MLEKYSSRHFIKVSNNPLKNPPLEIIEQGNAAILEYFKQKQKGSQLLLEAKLVLLGDYRAGKTSLANRLLGKPLPTENERTQGVDIIIGEYRFQIKEGEFKLNIWDFGGQDKYKSLHQFFYTEDAVYVLVADSGNGKTDYDDWLQTAKLFGAESPLVIALNEFSATMGKTSFDEDHWHRQFPRLIREVHLVNLLTKKRLPELETCLRYWAENLPHAKKEYPKNWAAIRNELERRKDEHYITKTEYLKICQENNLEEEHSALILSTILHKIGVCLHYQHNPLLDQFLILNNEWATQAVYKILEDRIIGEEKKGFFNWDDLTRIWADESYKNMRPQLLEMMKLFRMAYQLPYQEKYITPLLLPNTPPADWTFPKEEALELLVEYEFLPKALLTQFIVMRHMDIDESRTLVWRNGVVLRWPEQTIAEITKTKSRGRNAVSIRVVGNGRRGLLTSVIKTLRDLHAEYKGIRYEEIVQCTCEGCRSGKNRQHYFDFENLRHRLENGRHTVECERSLQEISLLQLMGDIFLFEKLAVGETPILKEVLPRVQTKQTYRIFLASSAELTDDRRKFRLFLSEKNDHNKKGDIPIYFALENWEAMSAVMSETRKQDDYNKEIKGCDLFICLVHTKVGKYTEEEFDIAWKNFKVTGKPKILTYFKQDGVDPRIVEPSLGDFDKKLQDLGHFPRSYNGYADLERQMWKELDVMLNGR